MLYLYVHLLILVCPLILTLRLPLKKHTLGLLEVLNFRPRRQKVVGVFLVVGFGEQFVVGGNSKEAVV